MSLPTLKEINCQLKITTHIAFFFKKERFMYLNRLIQEMNTYPYLTDIFIHTNVSFSKIELDSYTNGYIHIIVHSITEGSPYLAWKCRALLKSQCDMYDIFLYLEDDILVPKDAIEYYFQYKYKLLSKNYNLGFRRIEIGDNNEQILIDNGHRKNAPGYYTKSLIIDNETYIVDDVNPYCAFWIYDKNEFSRFIQSKYYDITFPIILT